MNERDQEAKNSPKFSQRDFAPPLSSLLVFRLPLLPPSSLIFSSRLTRWKAISWLLKRKERGCFFFLTGLQAAAGDSGGRLKQELLLAEESRRYSRGSASNDTPDRLLRPVTSRVIYAILLRVAILRVANFSLRLTIQRERAPSIRPTAWQSRNAFRDSQRRRASGAKRKGGEKDGGEFKAVIPAEFYETAVIKTSRSPVVRNTFE